MANERKLLGVLGFYNEPSPLVSGMKKVRDANYRSFDAFTPFPVHGLDGAMGLKRSKLPWVTLFFGLTGCSLGFLLQYWTSVVDWPLIVGGKPFNSWPAFVPVMFECTILFAGISTVLGLFAFCGLPNNKQKAFDPSLTRDRFAILIQAPMTEDEKESENASSFKKFNEEEATEFLKKAGAVEVRKVYAEGWF